MSFQWYWLNRRHSREWTHQVKTQADKIKGNLKVWVQHKYQVADIKAAHNWPRPTSKAGRYLLRGASYTYIISLICFFVEHISIWTPGQGYNQSLSLSLNEKRNWVWPDHSWFLHLKNFPLQILKFDTILLLPLIAAMRPALDLINWFPLQMWDQFFSANLWLLLHCASCIQVDSFWKASELKVWKANTHCKD